ADTILAHPRNLRHLAAMQPPRHTTAGYPPARPRNPANHITQRPTSRTAASIVIPSPGQSAMFSYFPYLPICPYLAHYFPSDF
ncbi:hypothetical protein, partial [Bifidobacterium thermophilum]|uniref:hypothetical protein n=1 Tax=Bifidobacterium thermophilum TaxID=33905 RepID=UPI001C5971E7